MNKEHFGFIDKLLAELKACSVLVDEISKTKKGYIKKYENEIYNEPSEDAEEGEYGYSSETSSEDEVLPENETPPEDKASPEDEISLEDEEVPEDEDSEEERQRDISDILYVAREIINIVSKNIGIYADEGLISNDERDEFVEKIDELKHILDSTKEGDFDEGALKDFIKILVDVVYKYIDITAVS